MVRLAKPQHDPMALNGPLSDLMQGILPVADLVPKRDRFEAVHPVDPYTFRDYQEEALGFVLDRGAMHSYLGLDMGLGKSLVGWALAASLKANVPHRYDKPILFVTPPALRANIVAEQRKFYPHLNVHVIATATPKGEEVPTDVDVIVIGDSALKSRTEKDAGTGRKRYVPVGWTAELMGKVDGLVVDEAHRHKNPSARSAALKLIADTVMGYKVLMSGTPAPNGRNVELARQMDVLGPEAWADIGGKGRFYTDFAPALRFGRDSRNAVELFGLMSDSWYFRRLRDDVEDLPNKGRSFVTIEGEGRGAREYLLAEEDLIAYLRGNEKNWKIDPRSEALVRLNNLRRLAGVARAPGVAAHVRDVLEDRDEGGVLVIAEHKEVIDMLMDRLEKYNPVTIRGGMTDKGRTEAVEAFTSGASRVLVGQITSAGTGFTLHGDGRNRHVVFAQLPWTPAEIRQAEDRLHRIGQTREVYVEITGAAIKGAENNRSIDERLWSALDHKHFQASALQDGEGEFLLEEAQQAVLDSYR